MIGFWGSGLGAQNSACMLRSSGFKPQGSRVWEFWEIEVLRGMGKPYHLGPIYPYNLPII